MTPEQREAERKRFDAAYPLPDRGSLIDIHNRAIRIAAWERRAEVAIAERAEQQAEIERLRQRVRELERENRKLKGEGMDPLTYWSM